jgi:hypothetical protein
VGGGAVDCSQARKLASQAAHFGVDCIIGASNRALH